MANSTKRKLVATNSFKKAFKRFTRNNAVLKSKIENALIELENNAFADSLKTHKLSGNLLGCFACSCGYDCRIVFSIEKEGAKEIVLLIDIGTHDEVY